MVVPGTRRTKTEFGCTKTREQVAIIPTAALAIIGADRRASPCVAQEGPAARVAAIGAHAGAVARISIDERVADARRSLTNGPHRVQRARTGAIARTGLAARARRFLIAFILRVLTSHDRSALAIDAAALESRRASLAKTRADVVTTHAVDAEAARALVCRGAGRTKRDLTLPETVAGSRIAFIRRIRVRRNVDTRSDVVLHVARLARARAELVAANAIDAIVRRALRIHHARLAVGQLACASTIALTRIALVVRILAENDGTAGTVRPLALQCARTGFTRAHTRGIAAIPIDTEAARAVRRSGTRLTGNALAIAEPVACSRIAFVGRIRIDWNVPTRPDTSSIRTRDARPQTRRVAANAIDAIATHALIRPHTGRTIALLATTEAIARARVAFVERIAVRSNGRTRPQRPRNVTRSARIGAAGVTTNAIDAIASLALAGIGARLTVGFLDLARGCIAEIARVAFAVGHAGGLASARNACITRLACLIELLHANALAIAGVGWVLRRAVRTSSRIANRPDGVLRATPTTRTNPCISTGFRSRHLAFIVGIRVHRHRATIAIDARPLLRGRTRLAFAFAARATTNTVSTITGATFHVFGARRPLGFLNARLARRLAQLGDAIGVHEALFTDETLHRTNLPAVDVGFGTILQTIAARRGLALVLEAISADAINADDASLAIRALLNATASAIEIRFVSADLSIVRTAEKSIIHDQIAVVVDAIALLWDKPRLRARNALRRATSSKRTLDLPLITRRTGVLREEARVTYTRNTIVDPPVAIVVDTVAELDTRERLSKTESPLPIRTRLLAVFARAYVPFLHRPGKTSPGAVGEAITGTSGNPDVVDRSIAIIVGLTITRIRWFGDHLAQTRPPAARNAGLFTRLALTDVVRHHRTGVTLLCLSRLTITRLVHETVAIVVLPVADVHRRLDRANTRTEFLIAAARHRAALAFSLELQGTFDLLARIVRVTRLRFPFRAFTNAAGDANVVNDPVTVVVEPIARITHRRQLLPNAIAPHPILALLRALSAGTFAERLGRSTITGKLLAVDTGQPVINLLVTIVIATVRNFLHRRHVAIAFAPCPLLAGLNAVPTEALAARTWRARVTPFDFIRHARAGVGVILVDQTIAIVVDTVPTRIRVVRLGPLRALLRKAVARTRRNELLARTQTAFQRRQRLATRTNIRFDPRVDPQNVRATGRHQANPKDRQKQVRKRKVLFHQHRRCTSDSRSNHCANVTVVGIDPPTDHPAVPGQTWRNRRRQR